MPFRTTMAGLSTPSGRRHGEDETAEPGVSDGLALTTRASSARICARYRREPIAYQAPVALSIQPVMVVNVTRRRTSSSFFVVSGPTTFPLPRMGTGKARTANQDHNRRLS